MTFHKQGFNQRFATMGDPAEEAFVRANPKHHRLGLNRPPFSMGGMSPLMRYAPDFMVRDRMVEVMGIATGGQGTLKLKQEKLDALIKWEQIGPVTLWVWDQSKDECWEAPILKWGAACIANGQQNRFPDNDKLYWELPHILFPCDPQPVEAQT